VSFTFLRWIRFGVAASFTDAALPAGTGPRAQATITVNLDATTPVFGNFVPQPTANLSVFGPGDVAGLDARQVIRTFPVNGAGDFESTFCAHVEFDRPDLPWMFTPVGPDANNLLRPWMSLVVVEKGENVRLEPATPLPVLAIVHGAADELPALADAALWAHVQIAGSFDPNDPQNDVTAIARDQPERILARLVCPRALQPNKSYLACVVPTYNVGVAAGLGNEVAADAALTDAWLPGVDGIRLPVFHSWEFATGGAGDFQSLVSRLEAHAPGPNVGTRALDVTTPGFSLPDLPVETNVELGGALRVVPPAAAPVNEALAQSLAPVVNARDAVGPPLYGRWHLAASAAARGTGVPGWFDALNLDPRYRVAAGLGTRVVQERQEDLMAAVWEQFGEIIKANQLLRQAQLAVAAAERIVSRHFAMQPAGAMLAIAGPALARIRYAPGKTVRRAVAESCLPLAVTSGAFRRVARTHGPLERRFAHRARTTLADRVSPAFDLPSLCERLAGGELRARAPRPPAGAVTIPAELLPRGRSLSRTDLPLRAAPLPRGESQPALTELLPTFTTLASRDVVTACKPLDLDTVAQVLRSALVPDTAIPPRVLAQMELPNARVLLTSRLDPIMAAPEIPTPMIGPLLDIDQVYLLPGLTELPPNTVTLVEPDAAFIESYFVGLNHEMGRELLWRGFPTDQRGTVFSRFWDRRGAVPGSGTAVAPADITPIAQWQRAERLGTHLTQAARDLIVLLMRGDLLQRYPRATIYLQRARWKRDALGAIEYDGDVARREPEPVADAASLARHTRFAQFSGRTGADLRFMGFMLPRIDVRGLDRTGLPAGTADAQAGWYVVFQEQPTEPRFGTPVPMPATRQADALAVALLRPAFRLFVHGSDLVDN
jgi:hypothetical protein